MLNHFYITFCNFIYKFNNLLWGIGIFGLIALIGIYFTIRIKCFAFIHIVKIFKHVILNSSDERNIKIKGNISHFQALSTALAASMGTGNIIGVAAAISMGGPGAIFWMWVSGLLGTSIGLVENTLGRLYKFKGNGPMGYISYAFKSDRVALLYATLCIAASFGIGNITQSNAISAAASSFNIPTVISGIVSAFFVALVIFRGGKKVASASEKLVPFVAAFYLIGSIFVIVKYGNHISEVLIHIVKSAFGFDQICGGFSGAVFKKSISIGLRRGIFSNEAGLGSSALVHSETYTKSAVEMGMFSVFEVIIDTIVCCTATAFVILLTGSASSGTEGLAIVTESFRYLMGNFSPIFVSVVTIFFAFCTLIGWYFYGEKCLEFTNKNGNSKSIIYYKLFYILAVFIGAVSQLRLVWEIADIFNWFMLVINMTAVIILHNKAVKEINNYTFSIK